VLLPHADRAEIAAEKLRDYLLSSEHPLGRFKARFFSTLGFSAEHWQALESAFRNHHLTRDAESASSSVYGQKFTIRAILTGPSGRSAPVISVWFIRANETVPRFVTAYPGGRQ
jgi:hypothetical protein